MVLQNNRLRDMTVTVTTTFHHYCDSASIPFTSTVAITTTLFLVYLEKLINSFGGFPSVSLVKNPPTKAGDVSSIPGSGRSPGEGNDNLL